jgi:hypothetical protein
MVHDSEPIEPVNPLGDHPIEIDDEPTGQISFG